MAILKRRKPLGFIKSFREALWPTMGWMRAYHYYRHRIFRTGDSTYKVTAGLATGIAVSFTPFLGTHFIQALLFTWLIRANWLAGVVGTLFGNPWTFPFLFMLIFKAGVAFCALFGLGSVETIPGEEALAGYHHEPLAFLSYLFSEPVNLLLPLTIGGYVCAVLSWPVAYFLLYYPVRGAQKAYRLQRIRIRRRRRRKSHSDTGYRK